MVSSNMVMSEGDPRMAGGWVLLPQFAEPVEVFVPCGESDLVNSRKTREFLET